MRRMTRWRRLLRWLRQWVRGNPRGWDDYAPTVTQDLTVLTQRMPTTRTKS